jgi:hypothetical protein
MAQTNTIVIEIFGSSDDGLARSLALTCGQPDRIVVTTYGGEKPITVIVSMNELRAALERLPSTRMTLKIGLSSCCTVTEDDWD